MVFRLWDVRRILRRSRCQICGRTAWTPFSLPHCRQPSRSPARAPGASEARYDAFLAHIHPDDRDMVRAVHERAYASGEPYQMVERIIRPDGTVRYLESNGRVIMDAAGTPERMAGTCVDITERI